MEKQNPARPPDKKKARYDERNAEEEKGTTIHGNISQGLSSKIPNTVQVNCKHKVALPQQKGENYTQESVQPHPPPNDTKDL